MKKNIIASILLVFAIGIAKAEFANFTAIDRPAQGVAVLHVLDVGQYDRFSLQGVYSDGTPSAHTFVDGSKQVATITIPTTTTNLIATQASATINVVSTTNALLDTVVVFGQRNLEGTDWDMGASTTASAIALAASINQHHEVSATSSGSTVTVTAIAFGIAGNSYSLTTTDATNLDISGALFTGGLDVHTVKIAGVTLSENTDFNVVAASATTADNIGDAIIANTTLLALFSTSTSNNVLTVTALLPGDGGYIIGTSTTGFAIGGGFSVGIDSDVDITNDRVSESAHGFTTGLGILFSTVATSVAPGGLTNQTTYYAIKVTDNLYKVASSSTNAIAGTAVDITGVTGSGSFTFTPPSLVVATSNGYKWQGSNDNTNWSDLSLSSITWSAAGNTLWDVGEYDFRYIRMNFTAPAWGALDLDVILNGQR